MSPDDKSIKSIDEIIRTEVISDSVYEKLSEKLPEQACQRANSKEFKGYDTIGYGYQWVVNRLNEVLGVKHWRTLDKTECKPVGVTSKNKQIYQSITYLSLQLGHWQNILTTIEEDGLKHQIIKSVFIIEAERNCTGGHNSCDESDAKKGSFTNALKKTAALFGIGKDAYQGTLDDDFRPPDTTEKINYTLNDDEEKTLADDRVNVIDTIKETAGKLGLNTDDIRKFTSLTLKKSLEECGSSNLTLDELNTVLFNMQKELKSKNKTNKKDTKTEEPSKKEEVKSEPIQENNTTKEQPVEKTEKVEDKKEPVSEKKEEVKNPKPEVDNNRGPDDKVIRKGFIDAIKFIAKSGGWNGEQLRKELGKILNKDEAKCASGLLSTEELKTCVVSLQANIK